jgi:hypothetical protein
MSATVVAEARARASAFLASTDAFALLGLEQLSADARMLARFVLELAGELEGERGARRRMQGDLECLRGIVGKAAYQALMRDTK